MAKSPTKSGSVYRLRIELDNVKPTIWRRVWVEGHASLLNLHHTIQAAMGWTDAHLHEFQIGGQWAGEDFDPRRYDRHAANSALLRMAWNRWGGP